MRQNIIAKAFKELFAASRTMFLLSYGFTLLQGLSRVLPIVTLQLLFDQIPAVAQTGNLTGILWFLLAFAGARILCHIIDFAVNYLYETYNLIAGYGMNRNVMDADPAAVSARDDSDPALSVQGASLSASCVYPAAVSLRHRVETAGKRIFRTGGTGRKPPEKD